jgi:hypothetical protein
MEQMGKPHYGRDQISGGVVIVAMTALLGVLRSDQIQTRATRTETSARNGLVRCGGVN